MNEDRVIEDWLLARVVMHLGLLNRAGLVSWGLRSTSMSLPGRIDLVVQAEQ